MAPCPLDPGWGAATSSPCPAPYSTTASPSIALGRWDQSIPAPQLSPGSPGAAEIDLQIVRQWASPSHPPARCHRTSPSACSSSYCPWSTWPTSRLAGGPWQAPVPCRSPWGDVQGQPGWAVAAWRCLVPSALWQSRFGTSHSLKETQGLWAMQCQQGGLLDPRPHAAAGQTAMAWPYPPPTS